MSTLYDRLKDYSESDYYGFHMPGHKRREPEEITAALKYGSGEERGYWKDSPYRIDISEIEGFDDLHHARGILLGAQERAARLYGAEETHFLVNGSTVGILSAVCGATEKGDTVLVARNCHKSVYHAIYLNELEPVYLYPESDRETGLNTQINPEEVRRALEKHPDIRAVVIVSPTYDGAVSDVAAIARETHARGIPLIVDEAHGAHFGFHPAFPDNSNKKGADIVIHSVHKTLPSLTQTALLHMNGALVNRERVRRYLDMLQSSSPSYVLLAGIDRCMELLEKRRGELFEPYVDMLRSSRRELQELLELKLVWTENYDISKLVISTKNTDITGRELYRWLLEGYHLQLEMAAGTYALAMTSVGDTKDGMRRLTEALFEIDNKIVSGDCEAGGARGGKAGGRKNGEAGGAGSGKAGGRKNGEAGGARGGKQPPGSLPRAEKVYSAAQAQKRADAAQGAGRKSLPLEESAGFVSAEYAYLYPPGIPLIVPGERISQDILGQLLWYRDNGFCLEGMKSERYIEVLNQ